MSVVHILWAALFVVRGGSCLLWVNDGFCLYLHRGVQEEEGVCDSPAPLVA